MALACNPRQHEPIYDIVPETGVSIEVFYTDRTIETFGRGGAGWFWWPRRRGWPTHRAVRDELLGLSSRDDYAGGDQLSMQERLANIASLSMGRAWDMDEPTQDTTASKSLVFLGTS
jgi:hypothetical protein